MDMVTNPFDVPELRVKIALQTRIENLPILCKQDKLYSKICDSEDFWRLRYQQDYPDLPLYYGLNYQNSYKRRYAKHPFGYYLNDKEAILDIYTLNEYYIIYPSEPIIGKDVRTPLEVKKYIISHFRKDGTRFDSDKLKLTKNNETMLFDMIASNDVDQFVFVSECLRLLNLDRLKMTLSESIDLLYIIFGSHSYMYDDYDDYHIKHKTKLSVLSSMDYNQLSHFLNNRRKQFTNAITLPYPGWPDYSSMMNAAITDYVLDIFFLRTKQGYQYKVVPKDFDFQRYESIKKLDLIKILFLTRAYYNEIPTTYPLYLRATLSPPDIELEKLFYHINQDNYIEVLSELGIRNNDNPSYYQGVARLTIIHSLRWILQYDKEFSFQALGLLGLPSSVIVDIKEWRSGGYITPNGLPTPVIEYLLG